MKKVFFLKFAIVLVAVLVSTVVVMKSVRWIIWETGRRQHSYPPNRLETIEEWNIVSQLIQSGNVEKIRIYLRYPNISALILDDGKIFEYHGEIYFSVIEEINKCGEKCKDIILEEYPNQR